MPVFREFAPAKINLTLDVLGKRPDGYHELKSLVAFADVGDVVTLDTSRPVAVTASGPFATSIAGCNLVDTTLQLIAEAAPGLQLGAVHLEKDLPIAAGIGGGSADAAAVIRAVQRANPERAGDIDWKHIALRIGADVPVCLVSHLAWMSGTGETVAPLKFAERVGLDAIIVNPLVPVPADKTAQVFRALGAGPLPAEFAPFEASAAPMSNAEFVSQVRYGRNALETAALTIVPVIADVLSALRVTPECWLARMSGGGPTCFALFRDQAAAEFAAARILREHPGWWVRATTLS